MLVWATARKNEPALIPPFFRERIRDQTWEISENQACILYSYIVIFFIYFILQAI